jgi:hypothetical protein
LVEEEPSVPNWDKLAAAKEDWARQGRLLTGRVADPASERLPPGQELTRSWPVLDLGNQPVIVPRDWTLTVGGMAHHPDWINEGIPMFFEKFMGSIADDGALNISFGYFSNWRFPVAKEKIETYTLSRLIEDGEPCLASSFILFLHTKGHMRRFVQQLQAGGKGAKPAELLVTVYGQPLDTIEREWKAWVAGQPIDGNVNLVPSSFVKTASEWRAWWQENKERLVWDETRGIYRVR